MCLHWCNFRNQSEDDTEYHSLTPSSEHTGYHTFQPSYPLKKEVYAIFLSIGYNGTICIQTGEYAYQVVRLFDFDVSTLYPNQIKELNRIYSGSQILVKWMDVMTYQFSQIMLPEKVVRLCQIVVGGVSLTDEIKRVVNQ